MHCYMNWWALDYTLLVYVIGFWGLKTPNIPMKAIPTELFNLL